jgi:hypothetical protein
MSGDFSSRILQAADRQSGLSMNETFKVSLLSLSRQTKDVKTAVVEQLCKGLNSVTSPTGAGFIGIWLGVAVENGADPEKSVESVLQCFFKWSQRTIAEDAENGAGVPNDPEIVAGLRLLGQSLVRHLSQLPDLRRHLGGSEDIQSELRRIKNVSQGATLVLRLLAQRNGNLVVINVAEKYGFRVRYRNIANCFHLFTLLQGSLAGRLPGTSPGKPLPRELALGKAEATEKDVAWWHYGQGHTPWPDVMASVWGEFSPDTIERIGGEQVLLLWPPILGKSWDTECFRPYLAESPPDVECLSKLTAPEINEWWIRLNLPIRAGAGIFARERWWKFWRGKRLTMLTGGQSGVAGE